MPTNLLASPQDKQPVDLLAPKKNPPVDLLASKKSEPVDLLAGKKPSIAATVKQGASDYASGIGMQKVKRLGAQLESDVLGTNQAMVEGGVKKILGKEDATAPNVEGAWQARLGNPAKYKSNTKPDVKLPYPMAAAEGAMQVAGAAPVAAVHGLAGKPLERNTGIPAELTDMLLTLFGGAKGGKTPEGVAAESPKTPVEAVPPPPPAGPSGTAPVLPSHEVMLKHPAHEAAKQQVLSRYAKEPVEHGVFMEGDVPKFSTVNGTAKQIKILPKHVADTKNGVFHHNHPNPGAPLSHVDIAALNMPGVGTVVAHDRNGSSAASLTPAGKQWLASLPDKNKFTNALFQAWSYIKTDAQKVLREHSQQGGKYDTNAVNYIVGNALHNALRDNGLIDYHSTHEYTPAPELEATIKTIADKHVKDILTREGFSNAVPNIPARNTGPAQAMDGLPQKAAGGGGSQPPSPPANQGGQGASAPNGGVGGLPSRASDELFKLSNRDEARRTEYVQNLKKIQGVPNETWEKLYAQKDNPALPRAPEEQTLYDTTIKQISDRSEQLINELKGKGIDFSDVGGAPRRRKGMSPVVEKIYGEKPAGKGTGRKTISTFSPAAAPRSMFALPGKVGSRDIVYVGDDGVLLKNGEPVGEITGTEKRGAAGVETSLGKLEQATTQEIEAQTKLQYHKNLLANEYLRVQSLERAKDASDFLDYLKKDPEFDQFATLAKSKETPADWRSIPDVRTFEGWKFDPRLAEVIEDYMGNIKSPEEYSRAVLNVAKAAKASIFINPIMHMINATNMFAVSKGLGGALRDLPSTPRALGRAIKSVLTQDKEYREMAKAGLSLPSMRQTAAEFNKQLTRAMGLAIRKEPRGMAQIAKEWGYTPVQFFKAYMRGSSKLLWAYSDILAMTRVNEYMARGLSREEAIRRTEQVMANYRVPSRVAGSRRASQALQNPVATRFGRYNYNRFANLSKMVQRAGSKDPQGWEARDQLLALAVMTTLGYTVLDKWLQKETKNKGAHQGLGGYSQMINVGKDVLTGKKSVAQGMQSLVAPGYLGSLIEAVTGQNIYTGKPIAQRGDWNSFVQGGKRMKDAEHMGFDVGRYMADKFMPINDIDRLATSDMTAAQFWLSQVGAQIPSAGQQAGRAKAAKYSRGAAKSANKKRPEWVK